MSLITKADVYQYLDQLTVSAENDALLDAVIPRAEDIIAEYLGYTWSAYDSVASTMIVTGSSTPWLSLPPHQPGTVTLVTLEGQTSAYTTDYTEQPDGTLYLNNSLPYGRSGWYPYRYSVTAKWGYGAVPESLKEVAIELTVNIIREKDKGMFSDVIGVDGANGVTVGYQRAFTNRQLAILNIYRRKFVTALVV